VWDGERGGREAAGEGRGAGGGEAGYVIDAVLAASTVFAIYGRPVLGFLEGHPSYAGAKSAVMVVTTVHIIVPRAHLAASMAAWSDILSTGKKKRASLFVLWQAPPLPLYCKRGGDRGWDAGIYTKNAYRYRYCNCIVQ